MLHPLKSAAALNMSAAETCSWVSLLTIQWHCVLPPSNGEVEGPDDHTGQGPRAHNLSRDPRPQTDHAPRTPPTIVGRLAVPPAVWVLAKQRQRRSSLGRDSPYRIRQ